MKYSLRRDGASLDTLLSRCCHSDSYGDKGSLIIIEDSWGYIFGGFISQTLKNKSSFYGSGESFVFSIKPTPAVYRWTGRNDFFVVSNTNKIAMGGGSGVEGGFSFSLDDELDTGLSNHSETFGNPPLASNEFFKCLNAEVWTFEQSTFSV